MVNRALLHRARAPLPDPLPGRGEGRGWVLIRGAGVGRADLGIWAETKGQGVFPDLRPWGARGGPVAVDIPAPWGNAQPMIMTLLQVAAGGAIGAVLRFVVNVGAGRMFGPGLPMGTVIVNVLGSFAMGVLVILLARKGGNHLAPFLMTGVLGGFTTFSAFSLDALTLWERGQGMAAAIYVLGSVLLSLAGIVAGLTLARSLT